MVNEYQFEFKGKTYILAPNVKAHMAAEVQAAQTGLPLTFAELGERAGRGSVHAMVIIVWSMLQKHHTKECSFDRVMTLIEEGGFMEACAKQLQGALKQTEPDQADVEALGPVKARPRKAQVVNGTGDRSISTHAASA